MRIGLVVAVAVACTGSREPPASCTATFRWLQKDAYRETAGLTGPPWPAHTTTVLEVACADGVRRSSMANHGTELGARDAAGAELLEEVKAEASPPFAPAVADELIAAFEACECEPQTKFMTMDDARAAVSGPVLANLGPYVRERLTCPAPEAVSSALALVEAGRIEEALQSVQDCTWAEGAGWDGAMTAAMGTTLAEVGHNVSDYHVCNNDAVAQARMFHDFVETGAVRRCDSAGPGCHGPKFLYTP